MYEAASKIQTAFRKYVERREKREKAAAVRIQNYYRKYRRVGGHFFARFSLRNESDSLRREWKRRRLLFRVSLGRIGSIESSSRVEKRRPLYSSHFGRVERSKIYLMIDL